MPEQPENAATEEENDFPARGPGGLRGAADVEKPAEPKDAETEEKKVHEQPEHAAAEEKQEAPRQPALMSTSRLSQRTRLPRRRKRRQELGGSRSRCVEP